MLATRARVVISLKHWRTPSRAHYNNTHTPIMSQQPVYGGMSDEEYARQLQALENARMGRGPPPMPIMQAQPVSMRCCGARA